jgi:hypothetical protein
MASTDSKNQLKVPEVRGPFLRFHILRSSSGSVTNRFSRHALWPFSLGSSMDEWKLLMTEPWFRPIWDPEFEHPSDIVDAILPTGTGSVLRMVLRGKMAGIDAAKATVNGQNHNLVTRFEGVGRLETQLFNKIRKGEG